MLTPLQTRLQSNNAFRNGALALLAAGLGIAGGLAVAAGNPLLPFAALTALAALPWLVTRPLADVALVTATVTLLPFAALPVRLAFLTPTLLEAGLLLLYAAWLFRSLLNAGEGYRRTPLDVWVILLLGATLFSFVLGLTRDPSTDVMHNYAKMILSIGIFFAAGSVIRTPGQVATVLKAIIITGALSAMVGAVLWRLPDSTATSLLTRLSVIGYPTERVIRYVEDNPDLGERAAGTQVDPNSFGGLLVVIAVFTGVQALARKPLLPRWLLGLMLAVDLGALVLTQSRAALAGVLVAGMLVATMRYRRLWGWGIGAALLVGVLGAGGGYFARIGAGLRFEDQANLMRLAEYRNALDIVARYPVFGVGFGTAGELDLTTGVSSVYLTLAERAGLLGLGLFLAAMLVFFMHALPAVRRSWAGAPPAESPHEEGWSTVDSALLGGTAAVLGVLTLSLADHYYFNIEFPHMAALFWLTVSLAMLAVRLQAGPGQTEAVDNAAVSR